MPNVQVAVGFRGKASDHLAPCACQVLSQLLRGVGDSQQAAITPADGGVHLCCVVVLETFVCGGVGGCGGRRAGVKGESREEGECTRSTKSASQTHHSTAQHSTHLVVVLRLGHEGIRVICCACCPLLGTCCCCCCWLLGRLCCWCCCCCLLLSLFQQGGQGGRGREMRGGWVCQAWGAK